jgi:hypothetical protein
MSEMDSFAEKEIADPGSVEKAPPEAARAIIGEDRFP